MSNDTAIQSLKEKIDDLNQQAWEARVNDSPKALELSKESVKLARGINYPKGLAEGLRSLGFAYVRLYKNDEAAPLLRESLSLFQSLDDVKGQAIVYEYLGIIERNWGNLGASLEFLLKGNDLSQQSGPLDIEITSCYQVGVTYKHLGNHENALDYLYKALSLSKKINFTLMESYATNIIGSIYFDNGDYNHALECYQQGLIIRQQSHDKWGEAGSLDNIGFTYLKLNDLDKAVDYCKQSLIITQSTGDKKGESNTLLHLAEIYEQAGDIGQASKFSNESLEIRKARGDKRGEAEVLLFLADLHKQEGDHEDHQVFEWLSGALEIAKEIKAQDILSKACYNLHEYHTQKGNYKESLVQLEAHLQIEKELHKNTINQKISNLEISHKAETISQRNKELTELNDQIEKANEELKIERSLERVRTAAMAMKEPADMLEVCKIISDQLEILDVKKIRNVQTAIFYEEKSTYMNYEYYAKHDKLLVTEVDYNNHPVAEKFANQMLKGPNQVWTHGFKGDEVKDWLKYQRSTNVFIDTYLETADSLNYYWYSLGPVALGMSTYVPLNEKEIDLFKRFRNVFELAYRRYLDIEKAQAQAREAQIEAAVEKVRSRSLAMHKSDELQEVVHTVFERLKELKVDFYTAIIILFKEGSKDIIWWLESKANQQYPKMVVPYIPISYFNDLFKIRENGDDLLSKCYSFDEKNELFHHLFENTDFKYVPEKQKQFLLEAEFATMSVALSRNAGIHITSYSKKSFSDQDNQIIKRFANVFDQSYTRFLDLQKAESQAREAQIEVALERVRSRSMAMHKSDELREVVAVLFAQLQHLGFDIKFCSIALIDKLNSTVEFWLSGFSQEILPESYHVPNLDHPFYRNFQNVFQQRIPYHVFELYGEEKKNYDKLWFTLTDFKSLPEPVKKPMMEMERVVLSCAFTKNGMIQIGGFEPLSDTDASIVQRFAKVFEQTHTRFLDLQKAEAQSREAQIELGLERVRARAMAMQRSDELAELVDIVFKELTKLHFTLDRCIIIIVDEKSRSANYWMANPESQTPTSYHLELKDIPYLIATFNAWKERKAKMVYDLKGDEKSSTVEYIFSKTEFQLLPDEVKQGMKNTNRIFLNSSFNNFGGLQADTIEPLSEENLDIIYRFSKVFDLTYTRFNDLKQAEAQARDAQIEAALEKVRAKVMAMTNSNDLNETSLVFGEQLRKLNIDWQFSYFWLVDEAKNENTFWITWPDYKTSFTSYTLAEAEEYFNDCLVSWRAGVKIHDNYVPPEGVQEWLDTFQRIADDASGEAKRVMIFDTFSKGVYYYDAMMKYGSFGICISKPATDEEKNIQCRFAIEFERAYTRFLDLKQAEAQAREARIETALEKVRASTMAMQRSEDLSQTAFVLFNQFKELGQAPERIFIATFDDHDNGVVDLWGTDQGGNQLNKLFKMPVNEPTLVSKVIAAWKDKKRSIVVDLQGEELKAYLRSLKQAGIPVTEGVMTDRRVQTAACFSNGAIGVTTPEPQSAEAVQLQERFAGVFDLTYTRFLDLQKAEEQAHKAQIETALERVRARALAMQEPEELKDVAQVLRTEMGLLGVEELETCSIYINDESAEKAECWYALKDIRSEEKKLVNDHFALNLNDTWVGREMLRFYQSPEKQTSIVMQGENRKEWIHYCEKHSAPFRGYYGEVIPDRTYHLYKFSHGAIGAAAAGDISAESWRMLSRAASVFTLAYSRFKDLTQARTDLIKLKEEKKRAEDALTELQATQNQLIQSEKMASLGELTAGIAHEIQNPLNFVNNFSDVSNELLEEMKAELEKGNAEEAKAIAIDVKENLEKILHHGKRADAIVKGMLQHSRSSSGQKEPTDINVLAEEYLRLAYHGLRAKDKFFNAKFETDLDPSINKINVVPQEIGRVILNLINNSFYAVSEKKKNTSNGYEPIVTVSTKAVKPPPGDGGLGVVEIRVKDNGNGIPKKVLDKIFQPFFTTKPTGQGTGLGLSLSYDIVTKGHDGEIKVETKEGEGSAFIISLPMK